MNTFSGSSVPETFSIAEIAGKLHVKYLLGTNNMSSCRKIVAMGENSYTKVITEVLHLKGNKFSE